MSQESVISHNHKMKIIYDFFERNKTIFTMIAIFGALAGFLYSLNTTTIDENLAFGILFLVFLMGLLMTLILYDALLTIFYFMRQKEDDFFTIFQHFFIFTFLILFVMFFFSLIDYLYSVYSNWIIWSGIAIFLYITQFFGAWLNTVIRNKIGDSKIALCFLAIIFGLIGLWLLLTLKSIMIGVVPHQPPSPELTLIAQKAFFFMILFIYSVYSILFFTGILIKQIFFPDKPTPPEEVI